MKTLHAVLRSSSTQLPRTGVPCERGLRLEIPLRLVPPVRARFSTSAQPARPSMTTVRKRLRRILATLFALAAFLGVTAVASATSRGSPGRDHRFSATYAGQGQG